MLDFSLRLSQGEFRLDVESHLDSATTGLIGPSGSGKTTLLHLLAGLRRGAEGYIKLDGETLFDSDTKACLPAWKRQIGMVFQDARLFPHLSVRSNLDYGSKRRQMVEKRFRFDEIIDLLELEPLLAQRPINLSGGEAQRVALGRALLSQPRLLLLDEPLASLDNRLKRQILPFLRRIQQRYALPMIHVSHDLSDVLSLTDDLLVMDHGNMVGQGHYHQLAVLPEVSELLWEDGYQNVFTLEVEKVDEEQGITRLRTASNGEANISPMRINGPPLGVAVGQQVQAMLRSSDIALVRHPVEGISIQNQVPAKVLKVTRNPRSSICLIDCGVPLLVEVTERSVRDLELREGRELICLFKTHSLRYFDSPQGQ